MIELNDWQLRLLQTMEKENVKSYIKIYDDHYYVRSDDLFWIIDDTQENREYAEEKLQEIIDTYEEKLKDKSPQTFNYQLMKEEMEKLKEQNVELRKKLKTIKNNLSKENYDKLIMEGIEL